ncbi:hypothetical protein OPT61_g683 [Boeremia exigua]|uniref:Uncharacterized protein n=1 Tax=Boeremia exigua TaxID=749465 RepID=A0ACC2IT04_9PLEO|nr:hypothetical protein OPT61_g683 [Boeremia exigua]
MAHSRSDTEVDPMIFLIQLLFFAHHLLGEPSEDYADWLAHLLQSNSDVLAEQVTSQAADSVSRAEFQQQIETYKSVRIAAIAIMPANGCKIPFLSCQKGKVSNPSNAYTMPYTRGELMPNNGDVKFLDERNKLMQSFLIYGVSQLMNLRHKPEFETYRQLLITCDRYAVQSQVDVEWTPPLELLQQQQTRAGILLPAACKTYCNSLEYTWWTDLALRVNNTRDVIKVLRNMIGSCCFVYDCIDFDGSGVVRSEAVSGCGQKMCG